MINVVQEETNIIIFNEKEKIININIEVTKITNA